MRKLERILDQAPGTFGKIARWIDGQINYSSPAISLGTALSFCAALKCKRVFGPNGIEPNLYTCVIASTGSGKGQAQKALNLLIKECELFSLSMGEPASDAGLLRALKDEGRRLLVWDEFGIALSELSSAKASHRALILSTMMQLYSCAGRPFLGKEYSQQERVNIEEPFFNLCAASTPGRFFGALDESFVDDGFLSRWILLFHSDLEFGFGVKGPERRYVKEDKIDPDIIEYIKGVEKGGAYQGNGNLAQILRVNKTGLYFESEGLFELYRYNCSFFDDKWKEAFVGMERILWSRSMENYTKVLIAVSEGRIADAASIEWAKWLLEECIAETVRQCSSKLGEVGKVKEKTRFFELIREGEKISLATLTKRAYRLKLSRPEREQLVKDFCESGDWVAFYEASENSQRKTTFYSKNKS